MNFKLDTRDFGKQDPETFFYPLFKDMLSADSIEVEVEGAAYQTLNDAVANATKFVVEDMKNKNSSVYRNIYLVLASRKGDYDECKFIYDVLYEIIMRPVKEEGSYERFDAFVEMDRGEYVSFLIDTEKVDKHTLETMSVPYGYEMLLSIDAELLMENFIPEYYFTFLGRGFFNPNDPQARDLNYWAVGPH